MDKVAVIAKNLIKRLGAIRWQDANVSRNLDQRDKLPVSSNEVKNGPAFVLGRLLACLRLGLDGRITN
jgi:hypothetical protein